MLRYKIKKWATFKTGFIFLTLVIFVSSLTGGSALALSTNSSTVATAAATPTIDCNVSIFNPLTWLICPIVSAAEGLVNALDSEITNELNIQGCQYFSAKSAIDS